MAEQTQRNQDNVEISDYDKQKLADQTNRKLIMDVLRKVHPNLFIIGETLEATGVNSWVICKIAQILSRISREAGGQNWGKCTIEIQDGKVLWIRGEEVLRLDDPLIKTEDEELV